MDATWFTKELNSASKQVKKDADWLSDFQYQVSTKQACSGLVPESGTAGPNTELAPR